MVKSLILAVVYFFIAPQLWAQNPNDTIKKGRAIAIDGDTLVLMDAKTDSKKSEKIRLYGLDAPEIATQMGYWSRSAMDDILASDNNLVECQIIDTDKYERKIGICRNAHGNLALNMIKNGWGFGYRIFLKPDNYKEYLNAEKAAKNQKLGFWADKWQSCMPAKNTNQDADN